MRTLSTIALALASLLAGPAAPQQVSPWRWVTPTPQGDDLFSVAWHDDVFVATGRNGTLMTSSDGLAWRVFQVSGHAGRVTATPQGFGVVASGTTGPRLLLSRGGAEWTATAGFPGASLTWFAGDERRLVALATFDMGFDATEARVLWSDDHGTTWTHVVLDRHLGTILPDGDGFVATGTVWTAGSEQEYRGAIFRSSDGRHWTPVWTQPAGEPLDVVHELVRAGRSMVAVFLSTGRVLRSEDGTNWSAGAPSRRPPISRPTRSRGTAASSSPSARSNSSSAAIRAPPGSSRSTSSAIDAPRPRRSRPHPTGWSSSGRRDGSRPART